MTTSAQEAVRLLKAGRYPSTTGRLSSRTEFEQIPGLVGGGVSATTDHLFLGNTGAGTPALARATKGGLLMTTTGSDNDATIITGVSATAARPPISATNRVGMLVKGCANSITLGLTAIGMGQAPSATDPAASAGTDSAEFVFDPAIDLTTGLAAPTAANWLVRTKAASGAFVYQDTGIPVVAAQDYELGILFGLDLKPVFYIDGVQVAAGATALAATTQICQVGTKATTAAARTFEVRSIEITREAA